MKTPGQIIEGAAATGYVKHISFLYPILCRIILRKGKSIREAMEEQGVLEKFLKNRPNIDPAAKYHFNNDAVAYEPFTNYLDVSEGEGCIHDPQLITVLRHSFVPLISSDFGLVTESKPHLPMQSICKSYELVLWNGIAVPFPFSVPLITGSIPQTSSPLPL